MKQLYFSLIAVLISAISFGQASDLYFSMYGEGSSNNKWLEIYNGTGSDVDLGDYSVELYSNGAATATNTLTFSGGTMLTNGDVYVIYNASADASITANGDISSSVTFFNGDDAIALLYMGSVIDVIGQIGVDPGSSWNVGSTTGGTVNHTLVRKAEICDPNPTALASFGTDDATSEWIVYASDAEWGQIGSHSGCSTTPSITITSPANSTVFDPGTTSVDIVFSTANTTGSETVDITVNSTTYNGVTSPYNIATTNGMAYTVTVELVDGGVLDSDSVSFSVGSFTSVADLAAARADFDMNGAGAFYQVMSTPTVTYTRATRNQKYIQDSSAGILIDDNDGIITTVFSIGDGMTGLTGTIVDYNGLLEFVPIQDASVTAGSTVTPEVVTIATLLSSWENYESELVQIDAATFADAGMTFASSTNYDISDGSTMTFRTSFSEADYIGQTIPSGSNDLVVLVGEFNGTPQVVSRSLNDFSLSVPTNLETAGFQLFPNPTSTGKVNIISNNSAPINVRVYDILGKQVKSATISKTLDVSSLKSGMYILNITQEGNSITKKLVIN